MKQTCVLFCAMLAISVAVLGCGSDDDSGAGGAGGTGGAEPTVPTEGLAAFLPFSGDAADESGNGATKAP